MFFAAKLKISRIGMIRFLELKSLRFRFTTVKLSNTVSNIIPPFFLPVIAVYEWQITEIG